jgi:hypothetical protein
MAGSIAFSGKAIIVKLAYRHGVDAVTLIMYRMLFALPLFALLAWWAGRGRPALTRRDWLVCTGLGFSGYYLSSFLDFAGLAYITASLERLILYLNPTLVLALGAIVFKRRVRGRQLISLAVSYCGVLLVFGHEVSLQGVEHGARHGLVFASAVSYAIYLVASGEEVQRIGALRLTGLATSIACLFCIAQFVVLQADGGARRRAGGDLALAPQRDAVHLRAGADGDDGDRARRRRGGGADGHDRAAVDDRDGDRHPRRAVHRLGRRRHGPGAHRNLVAGQVEIKRWISESKASGRSSVPRARASARAARRRSRRRASTSSSRRAAPTSWRRRRASCARSARRDSRRRRRHHDRGGRAAALAACPQVDILVNNAGGPPPGDFREWDRDAWLKALDANMLTPIELIKATVDKMAERGFGRVVNITSGR